MARRKPFLLRIDPVVHAALQRWADDEFRSLNGHLEYLLRESLRRAGRLPGAVERGRSREEDDSREES